jgi:type 1 fimbria pilin
MADYLYSASADAVGLTAARKTVLQIAVPAAINISIVAIDITFDGVNASATPVLVTLERQASAGTGGVALTTNWGPNPLDPNTPATTCTALKGPWATTEPVLTSVYKAWRIPPTGGLLWPFPLDQEPVCPSSSWIALVVNPGASVNATATITWKQ